jgi:uncharacterized SAM-binding protein YcdF (DUF218 family)
MSLRIGFMDIDLVSECFFLPDAPVDADAALVFGMNDWRRPTARAVALYRTGQARKLLFTGGFNAKIGATEAEEMAAFARDCGVPESDILVEPRARHTGENVQFARDIIEAAFGPGAAPSLMLVTIHYHLRRALIAARKYFPPPVKIGWSCYPSRHYSASDWFETPQGRAAVESEIGKIEKYYALGLSDLARTRP